MANENKTFFAVMGAFFFIGLIPATTTFCLLLFTIILPFFSLAPDFVAAVKGNHPFVAFISDLNMIATGQLISFVSGLVYYIKKKGYSI